MGSEIFPKMEFNFQSYNKAQDSYANHPSIVHYYIYFHVFNFSCLIYFVGINRLNQSLITVIVEIVILIFKFLTL